MENNKSGNDSFEKIYEWLAIYQKSSDKKERDIAKARIVKKMIPVVHKIAHTIARRSDDPIEDMVQAGFIGLLKAIDRFSYEKNDNFRVYAGYFIIGEIRHYLRDRLDAIRVPRHIHELAIRIHNFTMSLTHEELKALTNEEVADALDATPASVDLALQVDRRRSPAYFDDLFVENDSLSYEELIADDKDYNRPDYADAKIIFNDIIEKLPPDEQVVIDMYYKQDMTKREIAKALMVSPMCVTRRMKQAFDIMSSMIIDSIAREKIENGNLQKEEI